MKTGIPDDLNTDDHPVEPILPDDAPQFGHDVVVIDSENRRAFIVKQPANAATARSIAASVAGESADLEFGRAYRVYPDEYTHEKLTDHND